MYSTSTIQIVKVSCRSWYGRYYSSAISLQILFLHLHSQSNFPSFSINFFLVYQVLCKDILTFPSICCFIQGFKVIQGSQVLSRMEILSKDMKIYLGISSFIQELNFIKILRFYSRISTVIQGLNFHPRISGKCIIQFDI